VYFFTLLMGFALSCLKTVNIYILYTTDILMKLLKRFNIIIILWDFRFSRQRVYMTIFWDISGCSLLEVDRRFRGGGGGCCSCWWNEITSLYCGQLFIPSWYVEWYWQGKTKSPEKTLSQCHSDHHKYHMDWPGREPGPRRWEAED
jgi:hypothetical protein